MSSIGFVSVSRILIRCDSSNVIGSGHVIRCLALAKELRHGGHEPEFVTRNYDGSLVELLTHAGFVVRIIPDLGTLGDAETVGCLVRSGGFELVVKDHYGLDITWDALISEQSKLVVVDDRAGLPTHCDLYLNPSLEEIDLASNDGWLEAPTKMLGPKFTLIGDDILSNLFLNNENSSLEPRLSRVLISVGGVPSLQHLISVIKEVRQEVIFNDCTITVALGVGQPNLSMKSAIETVLSSEDRAIWGRSAFVKALTSTDLLISSGGSVVWERACLGIPAIHWAIADNQLGVCRMVERYGAGIVVNNADELGPAFSQISNAWLSRISERSRAMCDGLGVKRVAQKCAEIF